MTKFKLLSLNYYTIRYNHMAKYKVICGCQIGACYLMEKYIIIF